MRVAVGFRVKTGHAPGLVLGGSHTAPSVLERRDVRLSDPKVPYSNQPYHRALELSEAEGARVVSRVSRAVKAQGLRALHELAEALEKAGQSLQGVGIVAGSLQDPARVTNPHIRAHASEGKLFRQALEEAAEAIRVPVVVLVEKSQYQEASRALGRTRAELEEALKEMGRAAGRPWRAEERSAALGAWLCLVRGK